MSSTLSPGQSLSTRFPDYYLESPDRRFQVHVSRDGYLRLYAYGSKPVARRVLWRSDRPKYYSPNQGMFAEMGQDGVLRLYYVTKYAGFGFMIGYPENVVSDIVRPDLTEPGARLEVLSSGQVAIMGPTGRTHWVQPSNAPTVGDAVIPDAPTIFVPPGSLALPPTTAIRNDSSAVIGISDENEYIAVAPGFDARFGAPGALVLSAETFTFDPQTGAGNSSNAAAAKGFAAGTKTIRVSDLPGGKLALT